MLLKSLKGNIKKYIEFIKKFKKDTNIINNKN